MTQHRELIKEARGLSKDLSAGHYAMVDAVAMILRLCRALDGQPVEKTPAPPLPTVEQVVDYLAHARRKDGEQGGSGYRSTREAADYFNITTARARGVLNRMYEAGQITCGQDPGGTLLYWRTND